MTKNFKFPSFRGVARRAGVWSVIIITLTAVSCSSDGPSASERSRAAQDRINASQAGGDSVFRDID